MVSNPFDYGFFCAEELSCFGFADVGHNVRIAKNCAIIGLGNISIGDNVRIDSFTGIFVTNGKLQIGNCVHIGGHCHFSVDDDLTFGDYSGTSQGVRIYTANDDYVDGALAGPCVPPEYRSAFRSAVIIESMAILGSGSVVLPGVTVGEGATVGANAVVRKSLESWGVYAGNPLRRCASRSQRAAKLAAELNACRLKDG